jgi:hypothetical protein
MTSGIQSIAAQLRALIPEGHEVQISARDGLVSVHVHGLPSYDAGTELARRLGMKTRNHNSYPPGHGHVNGWCTIGGTLLDSEISVSIFCDGITPTCRLEQVEVTQEKFAPSGETETIKTVRLVCGTSKP